MSDGRFWRKLREDDFTPEEREAFRKMGENLTPWARERFADGFYMENQPNNRLTATQERALRKLYGLER